SVAPGEELTDLRNPPAPAATKDPGLIPFPEVCSLSRVWTGSLTSNLPHLLLHTTHHGVRSTITEARGAIHGNPRAGRRRRRLRHRPENLSGYPRPREGRPGHRLRVPGQHALRGRSAGAVAPPGRAGRARLASLPDPRSPRSALPRRPEPRGRRRQLS